MLEFALGLVALVAGAELLVRGASKLALSFGISSIGKVAQPLRVAITGTQVSPDISHTVYLAGRDEALKRIDAALIKVLKG